VFSPVIDRRGAAGVRAAVERLMLHRRFMPGGRYLYSAGRPLHQVANCLMCLAKDSREGWAEHYYKHVMGLSTGAGIGSVYSLIRPKGAPLGRGGGTAGGPLNLAVGINEAARTVRQGGDRRAALWAGLHWWPRT
jgi:ribonucleoside-diphosphate reductase alpha chain